MNKIGDLIAKILEFDIILVTILNLTYINQHLYLCCNANTCVDIIIGLLILLDVVVLSQIINDIIQIGRWNK